MPVAKCSTDGCEKVAKLTKGLCPTHYMRLLRHGRVDARRGWNPKAHLHSKHFMYNAWQAMILRCHDPKNSSYARYGARGIQVCQRWRDDFQHFLADMGERTKGMTLDRVDPLGNYEPENCRWADTKTQRANISETGDRRMRQAASTAKSTYWQKWREERGLAADETYRARRKAGKVA